MSHAATNWAIRQRGLKPATKIVLWRLADCHNPAFGCFPTQAHLAEACEMNRDTVNVHLGILEKRGLIRRERSIDEATKRQRPTRYHLSLEDEKPVSEKPTRAAEAVSGFEGEPCRNPGVSRVGNSDTNLVKEPVKEPVSAAHGFDEFWQAYPRRENRAAALKAWPKALEISSADAIVAAARRYASSRVGEDPRYNVLPANWLEDQRWTDQLPDVARWKKINERETRRISVFGEGEELE